MFKTPLIVELVHDTANDGAGQWQLVEPLVYEAFDGKTYTVEPGFQSDFASVPRAPFSYWLTGNTAHRPAVLHDWLCRTDLVDREYADNLFFEAMLSVGVPRWRAQAMHLAVRSYSEYLEGKKHGLSD